MRKLQHEVCWFFFFFYYDGKLIINCFHQKRTEMRHVYCHTIDGQSSLVQRLRKEFSGWNWINITIVIMAVITGPRETTRTTVYSKWVCRRCLIFSVKFQKLSLIRHFPSLRLATSDITKDSISTCRMALPGLRSFFMEGGKASMFSSRFLCA